MTQYIDPRAEFSLREAGRLVGCSADVIQPRLTAGLLTNARRDPFNGNGRWLVTAGPANPRPRRPRMPRRLRSPHQTRQLPHQQTR